MDDNHHPVLPDLPDALAYVNRGLTFAGQGNREQAIADYTRAIQLTPNVVEYYFMRGLAYLELGDLDRAIADYDRAIEIGPGDARGATYSFYAEVYFKRATAYERNGDVPRAIADFEAYLRAAPDAANADEIRRRIGQG